VTNQAENMLTLPNRAENMSKSRNHGQYFQRAWLPNTLKGQRVFVRMFLVVSATKILIV